MGSVIAILSTLVTRLEQVYRARSHLIDEVTVVRQPERSDGAADD